MFNKGGLGNLMKQAQQMQSNMQKLQDEIAAMEIQGQAQNGLVKVTMTGKHDIKRIAIDDSLLDDKDTLEDLIVIALNDANKQLEAINQEKMGSMTAGLGLPPGMKLPF